MDTLIVVIIGLYLFLESFTAVNEMPRIRLRDSLCEFKNVYTLKYIGVGLYGLLILYNASKINGWQILLVIPAIFCVIERTLHRLKKHNFIHLHYLMMRLRRHK